jgi:hypothetical protein
MERYSDGNLNQTEISNLLNVRLQRLNTVARALESRRLVEPIKRIHAGSYYRITDQGVRALGRFAYEVLGTPKAVEAGLQKSALYGGLIELTEQLIDRDLRNKFGGAIKRAHRLTSIVPQPPYRAYTWDEVIAGAEHVGKEIFSDLFRADAILTFSGPSSVFAGIVLAQAVGKPSVRVPVYTAFCDAKNQLRQHLGSFYPVPTDLFTILLPKALAEPANGKPTKNLAIIDDTIITGEAMRALREYFSRDRRYKVRVACCICYEARLLKSQVPPEVYKFKATSPHFLLPWGLESYSFEDALT